MDSTKRKVDSTTSRKPVNSKHVPAELTEGAKKRRKRTTSEDIPGSGMAKKAGKAIEQHKRRLEQY